MHYYIHGSRSFDDGLILIWDDKTTLDMLNIWYKNKVIDLYVEHDVDTPQFIKQPLLLSGPYVNLSNSDNKVGRAINEAVGFVNGSHDNAEGSHVGRGVRIDDVGLDNVGIEDIGECRIRTEYVGKVRL